MTFCFSTNWVREKSSLSRSKRKRTADSRLMMVYQHARYVSHMNPVNVSADFDSLSCNSGITAPDKFLEFQGFESNRNKVTFYSTYAGNMVKTFHLPNMYVFFLLLMRIINCTYIFQVFQGNFETNIIVSHVFQQHIKARFVRILPQTWNVAIAMRVELYGCSLQ